MMEPSPNVQKSKQDNVKKNMSSTSSQDNPSILPILTIIPIFELFKSKYPSITNDESFHIPPDDNTNDHNKKACCLRNDSCNVSKKKSSSTPPKKIDWTQYISRKRKNDESISDSKKIKYNNDEEQTKKDSTVVFSKPKFKLPLIVKDRAYRRLINTQKYFTKDQYLRPQFSQIIQPGSKLQLPLKEFHDLFCIFSQFQYLDEFYTFAQYLLR